MKKRSFTFAQIDEMKRLFSIYNWSLGLIAEKFKCDHTTVMYHTKELQRNPGMKMLRRRTGRRFGAPVYTGQPKKVVVLRSGVPVFKGSDYKDYLAIYNKKREEERCQVYKKEKGHEYLLYNSIRERVYSFLCW